MDQREAPAPVDSYAVEEREPGVLEWLFYGGTEPMRAITSATTMTPEPCR